MYLSWLLIDVGTDPDRPRPGRLWLRNRYRVHQRLCMAFPSSPQREQDPEFLMPYHPCGFPDPRPEQCPIHTDPGAPARLCAVSGVQSPLHVPRDTEHNFLFRIDPQLGGTVAILVQSAAKPDWHYAFQNAGYLLRAAPPEFKPFDPRFYPDQRLRFRVLANPVRKVCRKSLDREGKLFPEKWWGKEVPVPTADLSKWLERRAEPGWGGTQNSEGKQPPPGFRLAGSPEIQGGYVYVNNTMDKDRGRRIRSARYEGILEVTDADNFRNTLIRGIGPAKAFGFGLLSVAPG